MSQRIHSCVNNTNLDTIQCDAYSTRLIQKNEKSRNIAPKSIHTKANRETVLAMARPPTATITRNSTTRPNTQVTKAESLVRKELYTDNAAMVEVTVKTHNARQRARSSSQNRQKKETWSKVLKSQTSNENVSSFTHFDPLRTVHFLAKELQCKLLHSLPNDTNVQQLVREMQQALTRVPPDVSSTALLQNFAIANALSISRDKYEMKPTKLVVSREDIPESVTVIKGGLIDSSSQTPKNLFVEPEKLQQHLEESSEKIEKACRQMEGLCSKLKAEKEELEILLQAEKDTVKLLNKQIEEQKVKFNATSALVENLTMKNEDLESTVQKLQAQIDSNQSPSAQELKSFIQELQKQRTDAEEEAMLLKQQLTLATMEAEKYEAILQARDTQVKEIRNEMSQLQEVVNEQLLELQNPFSSDYSSFSNTTASPSSNWHGITSKSKDITNNTLSSIHSTDSRVQEIFNNKSSNFKDLHSGDTSATSEDPKIATEVTDSGSSKAFKYIKKRNDKSVKGGANPPAQLLPDNIRERFSEIKKQALSCNVPKSN